MLRLPFIFLTMTYKEYIYLTLKRFALTMEDAELICINQSDLIPNSEDIVDVKSAKLAMYREMSTILPVANITEGGMSLSWNMEGVKLWYKSLANELSEPNVLVSQLSDTSDIW